MDEPLVRMLLILVDLAMTIWVVKSVIDLLRQPVPANRTSQQPTWKVAAGAAAGLIVAGTTLWFFAAAEPSSSFVHLVAIVAQGAIVFALKREARKRQAAAS